jgi:uncharacterized phage-associated protein
MNTQINLYNEKKAAQVVAMLIYLNGKPLNMLKLVKLVYNIDREAFKRWYRPITFDKFCSMENGQVVSNIYDNVKYENRNRKSYWNSLFQTKEVSEKKYEVLLINNYDEEFINELSRSEIELIIEVFEHYKNKTANQMIKEHHNPAQFPEYIDPGKSSVETKYSYLLEKLKVDKKTIDKIESDIEGLRYIASMIH